MASQAVNEIEHRVAAGREYHSALKSLGFRPQAVFWAMPGGGDTSGRMELGIITSWADVIGPKHVYDLLFEAYDACATPKEIDPFIVTLFSPQTQVATDLVGGLKAAHGGHPGYDPQGAMLVLGMADYVTMPSWVIYWSEPKGHRRFDDMRTFQAFQRNVHNLAA